MNDDKELASTRKNKVETLNTLASVKKRLITPMEIQNEEDIDKQEDSDQSAQKLSETNIPLAS